MRLDHLLSKEHHRTTPHLCGWVWPRACLSCVQWLLMGGTSSDSSCAVRLIWLEGVRQTRCWVLGEQAPAALSAFLDVFGWCGGGVWAVCVSPGRPFSCVPALVGVCGWVTGCGSWFFHSGREHLDIMIVLIFWGGCGCGVLCNFCCCVSCVIRLALPVTPCAWWWCECSRAHGGCLGIRSR